MAPRDNNRKTKVLHNPMLFAKTPPQDTEAEKEVLGIVINDADYLDEVAEILKTENCFFQDEHQKIYRAILNIRARSGAVDVITIGAELTAIGELENIGGTYYLGQLLERAICSAYNVSQYCHIINEQHIRREAIRVSMITAGECYDPSIACSDIVHKNSTQMDALISGAITHIPKAISSVVGDAMVEIYRLRQSKLDLTGVPSGFREIDAVTSGWQKQDLIILAARPSVGKTAFVLNLICNAYANDLCPTPAALFSLEMGGVPIAKRLLAMAAHVPMGAIQSPKTLSEYELQLLAKAQAYIDKAHIYLDTTSSLDVYEFRAKARKLVKDKGVGLIAVDYLQLMTIALKSGDNREREIAKISSVLKATAKDLDIPIIALSQITRSNEKEGRPPKLSDLRESGAIEQDADLVMFLTRPTEAEVEAMPEKALFRTVQIEKNRNGEAQKSMTLIFNGAYQEFKNPGEQLPF